MQAISSLQMAFSWNLKNSNTWANLIIVYYCAYQKVLKMQIFHMYHNSLTAFHQGHWKTFLTMKEIFYIPNMLNKLRNYINACTDCLKYKSKPSGQSPVQYGYMPKDYVPMESLACNIKYMPPVFGGYKFILMVTCEQTNFRDSSANDRSYSDTHCRSNYYTCVKH